ncbi:hypothetical protein B0T19DRAFT_445443 [Cercophora scortea]|uniref:CorA-like transporter domain-containing protein n=1 Tax=Cercophora scortea TaxID=314031 RepID=A0AAE0I8H1_9PEZI|nr:hypothetical protein B0T19DRAFT_445443 [Cercophora scortea]
MTSIPNDKPQSMDPGSSQEVRRFVKVLRKWEYYPDNIPHGTERAKLVEDFKRHFDRTKDKVLLFSGANKKSARWRAIMKKVYLIFYDCGIGGDRTTTTTTAAPPWIDNTGTDAAAPSVRGLFRSPTGMSDSEFSDTLSTIVQSPDELEEFLGLCSVNQSRTTFNNEEDSDAEDGLEGAVGLGMGFEPRMDPVCRFIFLETSAPNGRRLKITEDMLLQILTYHHVSPCFLNYISNFGHDPLTGDSDLFFGGFRSLKSFTQAPRFNVEALGRSGFHYQLAFELKTVFDPRGWEGGEDAQTVAGAGGEMASEDGEELEQGWLGWLLSWLTRRDDAAVEEDEGPDEELENQDLWPVTQTAVYHHFDVDNGKSLWIITTSEKKTSHKFRDVKGSLSSIRASMSTHTPEHERFQSSLEVLVWLGEWSLSEYGFYIAALDDNLKELTRPYIQDREFVEVKEEVLKKVNRYMESIDDCIVGLKANMRVCKAILKFYQTQLLQDAKLRALRRPWLLSHREALKSDVAEFAEKIQDVHDATNEMLRRILMVKEMGTRREGTTQRLLQNRNEQTMKELAALTIRDATSMRVFATITLILLPMSVVSTVFTTDIVRFSQGGAGSSFVGSWSAPAAVWWTAVTVLTTSLVWFIGNTWRRVAIARMLEQSRRNRHGAQSGGGGGGGYEDAATAAGDGVSWDLRGLVGGLFGKVKGVFTLPAGALRRVEDETNVARIAEAEEDVAERPPEEKVASWVATGAASGDGFQVERQTSVVEIEESTCMPQPRRSEQRSATVPPMPPHGEDSAYGTLSAGGSGYVEGSQMERGQVGVAEGG